MKYVIRRTIPLVKRFSIRSKKINPFFIFALQLFYNYSRCFVNKFRKKTNIFQNIVKLLAIFLFRSNAKQKGIRFSPFQLYGKTHSLSKLYSIFLCLDAIQHFPR